MERVLKNAYSVTVGNSLRVTIECDGVISMTKSDEILSALTACANRVDSALNDAETSYEKFLREANALGGGASN